MKRKDRIERAKAYLRSQRGYTGTCLYKTKGVDLVVCDTYHDASIVFIAVMDADARKSIPLFGLGKSQAAKQRGKELVEGARKWIEENNYKGPYRFDCIWVGEGGISHGHGILGNNITVTYSNN